MITNNEENKNNNFKRRQHYIPQAYLKFFATKGKKEHLIWVYDCANNSIKRVSINNICVINDLYECKYFSDECNDWIYEDVNYIENHFVEYEGRYSRIAGSVISYCQNAGNTYLNINDEDKSFLALFMSQLLLRNQIFVVACRDLSMTPAMIADLSEKVASKFPEVEMEYIVNALKSEIMKDIFATNGNHSSIKAFSKTFLEDRICVFRSKNRHFITSDAPVVNVCGCKNGIEYDLVGMPISPGCYLAFIDSKVDEYEYKIFEIDDEDIDVLNNYQNKRPIVKYLFSKDGNF